PWAKYDQQVDAADWTANFAARIPTGRRNSRPDSPHPYLMTFGV
ncbi:MAG: hypothetical protein RLZZ221_663, partial [Verrucomicrobiota bacterium]